MRTKLAALIALIRPHHWVKNGFVAAPLFFTPEAVTAANAGRVAAGVAAFCLLSSAVYILNDYTDRDSDRRHTVKRHRPLAAGTVTPRAAMAVSATLAGVGFAVAGGLAADFFAIAALYVGLIAAYSFLLKRLAVLDVLTIAVGFVLRVEAGGALIAVTPSAWIVITTGLLALALGLAKRRDDLVRELAEDHRESLKGYTRRFLDVALATTLGAVLVAYLIYTTDAAVMARLGTERLFYTAPFVVFGILRYLQITLVEERSGSPTWVVLTDVPTICAVLGWLAVFGALIYG